MKKRSTNTAAAGAAARAVSDAPPLDRDDEPTQVTRLIGQLEEEGRRARASMASAVARAERTARRPPSVRNLRAVLPRGDAAPGSKVAADG